MSHGPADLRTARLRLRMISTQDVEAIARLSSDPRVNEHSPTGPPTLESARQHALGFAEDWRRDGIGYWVIERDGQIVGIAGVKLWELDGRECWNLYYRFGPEVWGQGIAQEVARTALQVAGELAPERPVVVRTRPTNRPAARVATAVGMRRAAELDSGGFITYVWP